MTRLSILVAVIAGTVTCGFVGQVRAQDRIRVGVWNIEKLSTTASRGFPELRGAASLGPRTDAQLDEIAEYIRDTLKADALMVTEIDADSPDSTESVPQSAQLNRIAESLGDDWRYFLGRTGGDLRLGLLFNTRRVRLKKLLNLDADEFLVTGKDVLDRDPFIAWLQALDSSGGAKNDFLLAGVHLKSVQKTFRNNRMAAVAKLIGDLTDNDVRRAMGLPKQVEEPELLILGDCNDSEFKNTGFRYMFDYLEGTGFRHLRPSSGDYPHTRVNGSQIDHIFASRKVNDQSMLPGTFKVHVPSGDRDEYRETFSDHFPVTVDLRLTNDNDNTFDEIAAITDPVRRTAAFNALNEALDESSVEPAMIEDEEPAGPPTVRFRMIDRDFDRILAPQRRSPASARAGDAAEASPPAAPAEAGEASAGNAPLRAVIDAIQTQIASILRKKDLTAADRKVLGELMESQRRLLEAMRD